MVSVYAPESQNHESLREEARGSSLWAEGSTGSRLAEAEAGDSKMYDLLIIFSLAVRSLHPHQPGWFLAHIRGYLEEQEQLRITSRLQSGC